MTMVKHLWKNIIKSYDDILVNNYKITDLNVVSCCQIATVSNPKPMTCSNWQRDSYTAIIRPPQSCQPQLLNLTPRQEIDGKEVEILGLVARK